MALRPEVFETSAYTVPPPGLHVFSNRPTLFTIREVTRQRNFSVILSVVNQKGGVGKTTTAVNLGAALARAGHSTLLVDLDPQGNATSGLGVPLEHRTPGTYEVLRGDVPADGALQPTTQAGYNVLPSTPGAMVELLTVDRREFRLRDALAPLRAHFRYIVIDAPPSLGILTMNALVAADRVLIPVQSEYYALEGLGQLLQTIQLVRERLHADLDILGAVVTMFDKRIRIARDVVRDIREHFPGRVFDTIIPRNVRLAEAPSHGRSIFEYDERSPAAAAFFAFANEVHAVASVPAAVPAAQS
jgi:chromosome partitioning protein